jgi:hypothetical protein
MPKIIAVTILMLSAFALANAALVYQRSYYLESTDRVDLQRLTDRVEQLDHKQLIDLSHRLVTISRADAGILFIMNAQFRQALLYVMLCLLAALGLVVYALARELLARRAGPTGSLEKQPEQPS